MTLPVPSQRTWNVNDVVTAAMMNANVRDAVNFLTQPPLFVGYQATAQTLTTSTFTGIALDTSVADTYSGHSNTVNNTRYTAPVAGWYLVLGVVSYAANATNSRYAAIFANGAPIDYSQVNIGATSTGGVSVLTAALVPLSAGGYVELKGYQNSGGNLATTAAYSGMAVLWVHA